MSMYQHTSYACNCKLYLRSTAARGGPVDWSTALQAGRSRVRLQFFIDIGLPAIMGSTRPLTEMSTKNISPVRDKDDRCLGLTILPPPSCADCLQIWKPQLPGALLVCKRPVQGFVFIYYINYLIWVETRCHLLKRSDSNINKQSCQWHQQVRN